MITKLTVLTNHQGFIRYFKNTRWMMGEQFLRIIAGLFGGIAKLGLDDIVRIEDIYSRS